MFHVFSRIWSWLSMAGMVPSQETMACGSLVAMTPQPKTLHAPGVWGLSMYRAFWAFRSYKLMLVHLEIWCPNSDCIPGHLLPEGA